MRSNDLSFVQRTGGLRNSQSNYYRNMRLNQKVKFVNLSNMLLIKQIMFAIVIRLIKRVSSVWNKRKTIMRQLVSFIWNKRSSIMKRIRKELKLRDSKSIFVNVVVVILFAVKQSIPERRNTSTG